MSLFTKTYDYEKDFLRKIFVLDEKKYFYFYGDKKLEDSELTHRSKKILKKENDQLVNNPQVLTEEIKNAKVKERFLFLQSQGYNRPGFEYFGPVEGTMSPDMETFLTNLTKKENVLLGIHRVQYTTNIDSIVTDVLTKGLILSGHINSGTVIQNFNYSDLANNISYYPNNQIIIKELMYANVYKNSVGSFLIEIPDSKLHSDDLLYLDENKTLRLNPKYIIGFVPIDKKHHINGIIKASDLNYNSTHKNASTSLEQKQSDSHYYPDLNYNHSQLEDGSISQGKTR